MKVFELSRELKVTNNRIKLAAAELGTPVKHHMYEMEPELESSLREYFATLEEEEPVAEEKPATRPWDADSNPWSLDMLRLKKKHAGFRPRFIPKENLTRRLEEGWTIADIKDYGGTTDDLVGEEAKDGTLVKRRELILVEMPEELAKKRERYIDWKSNERMKSAREMAKSQADNISRKLGGDVQFESEYSSKKGY